MTLATHAVVGGLIGAAIAPHYAAAAALGFVSHFVMDAIPHWDYHLQSSHEDHHNKMNNDISVTDPSFIKDLLKIGLDALIGLTVIALVCGFASHTFLISALIGGIFAMLPDPLQFVYMKTRSRILKPLQEFHMYIHAHLRLDHRPLLGILSQVAIIVVSAYCMFNIAHLW